MFWIINGSFDVSLACFPEFRNKLWVYPSRQAQVSENCSKIKRVRRCSVIQVASSQAHLLLEEYVVVLMRTHSRESV